MMHGHIVMPKVQTKIQKLLFGIQVWWSLRLNARLTYTFKVACCHRHDKECQAMKLNYTKICQSLEKMWCCKCIGTKTLLTLFVGSIWLIDTFNTISGIEECHGVNELQVMHKKPWKSLLLCPSSPCHRRARHCYLKKNSRPLLKWKCERKKCGFL